MPFDFAQAEQKNKIVTDVKLPQKLNLQVENVVVNRRDEYR